MKIITIENRNGRRFNVKLVQYGEHYGKDEVLKAEANMVEFYDAKYSDHGPLGQFVSRYYLTTLLESRARTEQLGLMLDGGVPVWSVDEYGMRRVYTELLGL